VVVTTAITTIATPVFAITTIVTAPIIAATVVVLAQHSRRGYDDGPHSWRMR
jgi:hypothetical protein